MNLLMCIVSPQLVTQHSKLFFHHFIYRLKAADTKLIRTVWCSYSITSEAPGNFNHTTSLLGPCMRFFTRILCFPAVETDRDKKIQLPWFLEKALDKHADLIYILITFSRVSYIIRHHMPMKDKLMIMIKCVLQCSALTKCEKVVIVHSKKTFYLYSKDINCRTSLSSQDETKFSLHQSLLVIRN